MADLVSLKLPLNCLFQLTKVPRLEMVETIDSVKLANELNKRWSSISPSNPLNVLVQVNTSQEEGSIWKLCET